MMMMHMIIAALLLTTASQISANEARLTDAGQSRVAIYVEGELMRPNVGGKLAGMTYLKRLPEQRRRLARDSVTDLARCLEKMSGCQIPIQTNTWNRGDVPVPILIGSKAIARFGGPQKTNIHGQGYRLVISESGIGCIGQTPEGISYAIYELLDRLGCRWYMPGDIGEVLPERPTLTLPATDMAAVPHMIHRNIWYASPAYKRRNRLGGPAPKGGHILENYLTEAQRTANPGWAGVGADGKPNPKWKAFNWASEGAADAVADRIIEQLDSNYEPSVSLCPADTTRFSQSAEEKALDTGDIDPTFGSVSLTDRLLVMANRVASRVTEKYPNVVLALYAYVNYSRPPLEQKPHPNIAIGLAPITYNRVHPMTDKSHPTSESLRYLVEGWGRVHDNIFFRGYVYNLADATAPCPMIAKWSEDIPICIRNGVKFWMPETMATFESNLPGLWLNVRLGWHTDADPAAVMDDLYKGFYGAAEHAMRDYWTFMDDAWVKSKEWSGGGHGHSQRFPPEVMVLAREKMDLAIVSCSTAMEYRRVKLAADSLSIFEQFMEMKSLFGAGKLGSLDLRCDKWLNTFQVRQQDYSSNASFGRFGPGYFKRFFEKAYRDGARISRDFIWISGSLRDWKYQQDTEEVGINDKWFGMETDDTTWKRTDVTTETWSTLGCYQFMGTMWYRTTVKPRNVPAGKKTFVWISKFDGEISLYVNGLPVHHLSKEGELEESVRNYCVPYSFDVTQHLKQGIDNQITVRAKRTTLNELGTGGLLGPVMLYREK